MDEILLGEDLLLYDMNKYEWVCIHTCETLCSHIAINPGSVICVVVLPHLMKYSVHVLIPHFNLLTHLSKQGEYTYNAYEEQYSVGC